MRARSQIIVRCSVSRHSSKANSRLQKYRKNPPSKKKQQWEVPQYWKHLFPRCVLWRLSIPLVGLRVYLLMIKKIFFCFVNFFYAELFICIQLQSILPLNIRKLSNIRDLKRCAFIAVKSWNKYVYIRLNIL
jgi:hypothetical protein